MQVNLSLSSQKITRYLFISILILNLVSLIVRVFQNLWFKDSFIMKGLTYLVSSASEKNIPTFISCVLLFTACLLFLFISFIKKQEKDRYFLHWLLLSFVFLFLAWDEAVQIHELVSNTKGLNSIKSSLNLANIDFFAFTWVLVAIPLVLIFGIIYLQFFFSLSAKYRNLFLMSFILYVVGAVGFEILEGGIMHNSGFDSLSYIFASSIEEFMEMSAIIILISALFQYISSYGINLNFLTTNDHFDLMIKSDHPKLNYVTENIFENQN